MRLRRGPVALAAQYGGFCILDEINMAKNDAVAVLHSALDYRRLIDVPGYECIPIPVSYTHLYLNINRHFIPSNIGRLQ